MVAAFRLSSLCFLLLALFTFTVQADPFADPQIQEIQRRHDLGVKGDKKVVTELIADLEKWTKETPDNKLLLAYLGSTYTLHSRDLFPGPSKFSFLKLGLKTMDEAVAAAPNDVAVRFIRAINNYQLPSFINRRDNARKDFQILLASLGQPEVLSTLNSETMQAIYYYAGLSYEQEEETDKAKAAWRSGLKIDSNSALGKKISVELARL